MVNLYVEKLHEGAKLPFRATNDAAAMDVCAYTTNKIIKVYDELNDGYNTTSTLTIEPGMRAIVPTGLKVCCDPGYCVKIYPRSSYATKLGLSLANCVGVIDADYRDELMVAIINHSDEPHIISHGDRIAQIMVERVEPVQMVQGRLPPTDSNRNGGFGSTGS
jgi:dUTP pyrophosphatase